MEFLEALVPQPQGAGEYKKESFEFSTKGIHRHTREMVASTLTSTSMSLSKL